MKHDRAGVIDFGGQYAHLIAALFFLIALCCISLACRSYAIEPDVSPIKIGLVLDLSGPEAYFCKQTRIGAELVRDDLQKEGKELNLVFGDSALQAQKGIAEIQKMLSYDNVDALWVDISVITLPAAQILKDSGKSAINCSTSTDANKINPLYTKVYIDYEAACALVAKRWLEAGLRNIAIVRLNAELGERCYQGAKRVVPALKVYNFNGGDSMAPIALELKKNGVQASLYAGFEPDFINLMKEAKRIQLRIPFGGDDGDILSKRIVGLFGNFLKGYVGFRFKEAPEDFIARVKARDPSNDLQSIEQALLAYAHLRQLYDALSKCPSRQSACVMARMNESKEDPRIGFLGFKDRVAQYNLELRVFE